MSNLNLPHSVHRPAPLDPMLKAPPPYRPIPGKEGCFGSIALVATIATAATGVAVVVVSAAIATVLPDLVAILVP